MSYLRGSDNAPLNIDYHLLANFLMCRNINGIPHPFRIKRQLARTRKTCKTVINGGRWEL